MESAIRRQARTGLVHGPYLGGTCRASIETARGGACTKLRRRFSVAKPQLNRPPRGRVRDFSRRSRTRLQQTLCAMPIAHVSRGMLFVTLTYPDNYPGDWALWKAQLHNWRKRLFKRCPRAAFVWKLEPQKRGAPHFHLLVVGVPFLSKDWLSETWYEVVGSGDPKHLSAGTQVQLVRSHRGVKAYAAKYTAKHQVLPDGWQNGVGRWWGVYGRERLGISYEWTDVSQRTYYALVRQLRHLIAVRNRARGRGPPRPCPSGMWAVLTDVQAHRLLGGLLGTDEEWRANVLLEEIGTNLSQQDMQTNTVDRRD